MPGAILRIASADYFEEVLSRRVDVRRARLPEQSPVELARNETPPLAQELMGTYLSSALPARPTHRRNAHGAGLGCKDPAFAPEPFTALYRRSLYQSMRTLADQSLSLLEKRLKGLPEDIQADAAKLLQLEGEIFDRCDRSWKEKPAVCEFVVTAIFISARSFHRQRFCHYRFRRGACQIDH